MTNQIDTALGNTVLQLLSSEGSQAFAEGLHLLVNQAKFDLPQIRSDLDFYPRALEKGLIAAMAEMYVQGVFTRKVSAIVEQLCGHAVSSSQVSKCTSQLDAELQVWRQHPSAPSPMSSSTPATKKSALRIELRNLANEAVFYLCQWASMIAWMAGYFSSVSWSSSRVLLRSRFMPAMISAYSGLLYSFCISWGSFSRS